MLFRIVPVALISLMIFGKLSYLILKDKKELNCNCNVSLILIHKYSKLVQPSDSLQQPSNTDEQMLYVSLLIHVDTGVFNRFDRDAEKVQIFCKDLVNIVNLVSNIK